MEYFDLRYAAKAVISKKKLNEFLERHAGRYHTLHELRITFPRADKVGEKVKSGYGT